MTLNRGNALANSRLICPFPPPTSHMVIWVSEGIVAQGYTVRIWDHRNVDNRVYSTDLWEACSFRWLHPTLPWLERNAGQSDIIQQIFIVDRLVSAYFGPGLTFRLYEKENNEELNHGRSSQPVHTRAWDSKRVLPCARVKGASSGRVDSPVFGSAKASPK